MTEIFVLNKSNLPPGSKKAVKVAEQEILLVHHEGGIAAVQAKCPHAGAPLDEGAVCNGRLICPWHMATFALPSGELLEPPAMERLKSYEVLVKEDGIYLEVEQRLELPKPFKAIRGEAIFLIVGTGAAGSIAATTLRQNGFDGLILAVDPIASEPVDRTQLSKDSLGGKVSLDEIGLQAFSNLETNRIRASLQELRAAEHRAYLDNGAILQYDRALIATGCIPKCLQIPGSDLAYTIRHSEDVEAILNATKTAKDVVIIGGSFIALEAASALVQKGLHVTVAARECVPFEKQFGNQAATALKTLHESNGTHFRLGVEIERITGEEVTIRERGEKVLLPADLVIMGVGVEPALKFKHDLPVAEDGGIRVDVLLSAAKDIWVAGDIANVNGARIEHWRVAQQHGRTAALAMLGQNTCYEGVPFFWTYHFGKRLDYLGAANNWDDIVIDGSLEDMKFLAFYLKHRDDGQAIQAVLSCQRESETALLAELMRSKPTLAQARAALSSIHK